MSTLQIKTIWTINLALFLMYMGSSLVLPYLQGSVLEYANVSHEPFDGTVHPIALVPDWLSADNTNKTKQYTDFALSDFLPIPRYDIDRLQNGDRSDSDIVRERYTYPVVYMGSYRGNSIEYDGSHLAVDIRTPIGTPVRSIANGVVVKSVSVDTGIGLYVVVRHSDVPYRGDTIDLYSSYLHLSEVLVEAGTPIEK